LLSEAVDAVSEQCLVAHSANKKSAQASSSAGKATREPCSGSPNQSSVPPDQPLSVTTPTRAWLDEVFGSSPGLQDKTISGPPLNQVMYPFHSAVHSSVPSLNFRVLWISSDNTGRFYHNHYGKYYRRYDAILWYNVSLIIVRPALYLAL
jgi:hypothetical protein